MKRQRIRIVTTMPSMKPFIQAMTMLRANHATKKVNYITMNAAILTTTTVQPSAATHALVPTSTPTVSFMITMNMTTATNTDLVATAKIAVRLIFMPAKHLARMD